MENEWSYFERTKSSFLNIKPNAPISNIRLQKEKDGLIAQLANLIHQNRDLKRDVSDSQQLVQDLEKDKLKDTTEIARLKGELQRNNEILDSINDKLKKLSPKEPSTANQEELNPETKKNLIEWIRVLQTRVNTEKQSVQNLKEDKRKDSTEIKRLKDNLEITKKKIDELNIDLNKTKNINKDLVREALKIKEELNDSIKNRAVLKEEKEQLLQKVQDLEVKVSQMDKMMKESSSGTEEDEPTAQLTKPIKRYTNLWKIVSTQDQDLKINQEKFCAYTFLEMWIYKQKIIETK